MHEWQGARACMLTSMCPGDCCMLLHVAATLERKGDCRLQHHAKAKALDQGSEALTRFTPELHRRICHLSACHACCRRPGAPARGRPPAAGPCGRRWTREARRSRGPRRSCTGASVTSVPATLAAGALERRREGGHQLRDHVEGGGTGSEALMRSTPELHRRICHLSACHACCRRPGAPARGRPPAAGPCGGGGTGSEALMRSTWELHRRICHLSACHACCRRPGAPARGRPPAAGPCGRRRHGKRGAHAVHAGAAQAHLSPQCLPRLLQAPWSAGARATTSCGTMWRRRRGTWPARRSRGSRRSCTGASVTSVPATLAAGALERRREGDHQLRDHVEGGGTGSEALMRSTPELHRRICHLSACHACCRRPGAPARGRPPAARPCGGGGAGPGRRGIYALHGGAVQAHLPPHCQAGPCSRPCPCTGGCTHERSTSHIVRQCIPACACCSGAAFVPKGLRCQESAVRCSPDQSERLGGVLAIDELIDVKVRRQGSMPFHVAQVQPVGGIRTASVFHVGTQLQVCKGSKR